MLEHTTLQTGNLEGARAFLETGKGEGRTVADFEPQDAYRRYAAGHPIGRLIPGQGGPVDRAGETIDHVAFRLNDHEAMPRKLDRLSIPYSQELGERRPFIRTPTASSWNSSSA